MESANGMLRRSMRIFSNKLKVKLRRQPQAGQPQLRDVAERPEPLLVIADGAVEDDVDGEADQEEEGDPDADAGAGDLAWGQGRMQNPRPNLMRRGNPRLQKRTQDAATKQPGFWLPRRRDRLVSLCSSTRSHKRLASILVS